MTEPEDQSWKRGVASVQDSLRAAPLPKRFYKDVTSDKRDGGFAILLDGRPVRTPAKKHLLVPSASLGIALAEEWRRQVTVIDPATMPLTRLVNSALDGVTGREADVAAEIVRYAGGDLLFYRANGPAALVERQAEAWDPVIAWAEKWAGGRFILAEGIMPVTQPQNTLVNIAARISALPALPLSALNVMTTLTGSALLALAHAHGRLDVDQAWLAAHVDEDYQMAQWGTDTQAELRRANRWRDMQAASQLWALSSVLNRR
jgi:chaperone required for assembly of F1-ATPase